MPKPVLLIVAGEPQAARDLERSLRDLFTIQTTDTTEQALEMVAGRRPAVILAEQRLPALNGVELLRLARDLAPECVGVLFSDSADAGVLADAINLAGVRGFVLKPWDEAVLRRLLAEAAGQAHDLQAARRGGSLAFAAAVSGSLPDAPAAFLSHLSDGLAVIRERGALVYYNSSFARLLNLPETNAGELWAAPHLSACAPLLQAVGVALGGRHTYAEFQLSNSRGEARFLEVSATAVPQAGAGFQAVLLVRDQTERQQMLAHLAGLNAVAAAINQSDNFDERIRLILAATVQATGADGGQVFLVSPGRDGYLLHSAQGLSTETDEFLRREPVPAPPDSRLRQEAVEGPTGAGHEVRVVTPGDLAWLPRPFLRLAEAGGVASIAYALLSDPCGISGVLALFSRTPGRFGASAQRLLGSIASQAGLALHNAQLLEELRLQARQDSLTGLLNRRYLLDLAEREFQRAQRYRTTLAVAMLDLDGFKAVNDRFGHAAGDKVLQQVALCLAENVRSVDMVGRYGGDEFLLVLPDTGEDVARRIAGRLQEQVENLALDVGGVPVSLSLSVGVAVANSAEADSLKALIALADAEMYRAKGTRRAEWHN